MSHQSDSEEQDLRHPDMMRSDGLSKSMEDPLTMELFEDPVQTPCGHRYDRTSIGDWIETGNNACPLCRAHITKESLRIDHAMRERLGLPEMKEPELKETPTPVQPQDYQYPIGNSDSISARRERTYETGDQGFTCLYWDHEDYPTRCFCYAARCCECHPDIFEYDNDEPTVKDFFYILCWCWLCGLFSLGSLGTYSYHECRTMSMICYPLWLLTMFTCFFFELLVRVIVYVAIAVLVIVLFVLPILFLVILIGPICLLTLCLTAFCDCLAGTNPSG